MGCIIINKKISENLLGILFVGEEFREEETSVRYWKEMNLVN